MADLRNNFVGIKSPNPFWLASAPPTDKEYNVERAFKAGWGGVVWKTLVEAGPPVVNVNGPRYGAIWAGKHNQKNNNKNKHNTHHHHTNQNNHHQSGRARRTRELPAHR